MSLRDRAVSDVAAILRNTLDGGQPITLTDPSDVATAGIIGWTSDVSSAIDPDTGAIISGRSVRVTIDVGQLPAGPRPKAQSDSSLKPWRVSFPRITTAATTQYAVTRSLPDDTLGMITIELGNWSA
jgi:hypothetical protein